MAPHLNGSNRPVAAYYPTVTYSRIAFLALAVVASACGDSEADAVRRTTQATFDEKTGRLSRLTADLNKDGVVDTWTYLDGTTVLRTESDTDKDGQIDRWEVNFPDGRVERVGVSLRKTGRPDMWVFPDPGQPLNPIRKEFVGLKHETRVVRWEFYEAGRLRRVEEDSDEDGRVDRWETNDGPTVLTAAFDRNGDGRPDERLTYDPTGRVLRRDPVR